MTDEAMRHPGIRPLQGYDEAQVCARWMSTTDPWVRLGRSYESCLARFSDPTRETMVAVEDGELAGFLILTMHGAFRGYIQTVCVPPAVRGRGIGTRLIAAAEERIFRESPNVFLCVSSFNTSALRLYERLGYQLVGRLTEFIIRGADELLLRKSLGPQSEFHS